MAKRGPAPRTDGEKAFAGRPPMEFEVGECPEYLDEEARKEFERVKELTGGRISGGDRAGFIRYCAMWSQWVAMQEVSHKEPFVVETESGRKVNSFWTAYRQLHRDLLTTEDKYTLTPACRSRMSVDTSEPEETEEQREMFGDL